MSGFQEMLSFLELLRVKRISFSIEQQRDNALMVTFALVGARVEVEFFEDHLEYSTFFGDEGVDRNKAGLLALIDKYLGEV